MLLIRQGRGRVRTLSVFLLSFLLLSFWHCAGRFSQKEIAPDISVDLLFQKIQAHAENLHTFQGWGRFSMVSNEGNHRGMVKVVGKMPDSLWIKMEGPFGVDVATACIGSNEMLLYSPWDHIAYQGSIHNNWIFEFTPGDIDSSQYVLGMMGLLIPNLPARDSLKTFYQKRNRYVLDFGKNGSLWVNVKGPVVSRWEKSDEYGRMCWLWEAGRFKKKGKVYVPQQVKWTSYESKQRISLFYEKIKTNRKLKNGWCHIHIPEGVDTLAL